MVIDRELEISSKFTRASKPLTGLGGFNIYIYIYGPGGAEEYYILKPTQNLPKTCPNLPKTSGGPVRIICTKFRSISMVSERVMIENPPKKDSKQ